MLCVNPLKLHPPFPSSQADVWLVALVGRLPLSASATSVIPSLLTLNAELDEEGRDLRERTLEPVPGREPGIFEGGA